jgi:hypothetical protein
VGTRVLSVCTKVAVDMGAGGGTYVLSGWGSSKSSRHPAPWSRMPCSFLSRIICDSFGSTVDCARQIHEHTETDHTRGRSMMEDTWSICAGWALRHRKRLRKIEIEKGEN